MLLSSPCAVHYRHALEAEAVIITFKEGSTAASHWTSRFDAATLAD